jgi:hypothetical protein
LTAANSRPPVVAGNSPLAIVPSTMDEVARIAEMVHAANMAPYGFKTPQAIGTAIMMGLELGLKPMFALQKIAVINGRPSIWGDAVPALIYASQLVDEFEEWIEGEGDDRVAHCKIKRKGFDKAVERTFSVADAKQARLWDTREIVDKWDRGAKVGQKPNDSPWFKYPARMLQMRARGFCSRDAVPDVLGGLYLREELEPGVDAIDITESTIEEPVRRVEPPAPPPPPPPPENAPPPPSEPPADGLTADSASGLVERFRFEIGSTENPELLDDIYSDIIGPHEDALESFGLLDDAVRALRMRKAELEQ